MKSCSIFQLIVFVFTALNFAVLAHSHRAVTNLKALKPAVPAQNHMAGNVSTYIANIVDHLAAKVAAISIRNWWRQKTELKGIVLVF